MNERQVSASAEGYRDGSLVGEICHSEDGI